MRGIREFIREEDGVGVVELILILVVLIGLVLTAATLVYMEYRNIESSVEEEKQTAER